VGLALTVSIMTTFHGDPLGAATVSRNYFGGFFCLFQGAMGG